MRSLSPPDESLPDDDLFPAITDDAFGVVTLTLHTAGCDYGFVPARGDSFTDTGSGSCAEHQ